MTPEQLLLPLLGEGTRRYSDFEDTRYYEYACVSVEAAADARPRSSHGIKTVQSNEDRLERTRAKDATKSLAKQVALGTRTGNSEGPTRFYGVSDRTLCAKPHVACL